MPERDSVIRGRSFGNEEKLENRIYVKKKKMGAHISGLRFFVLELELKRGGRNLT